MPGAQGQCLVCLVDDPSLHARHMNEQFQHALCVHRYAFSTVMSSLHKFTGDRTQDAATVDDC